MSNFGIGKAQQKILIDIFSRHLITGVIVIYGSRVKGTFSESSDVDLVLKNSEFNHQQLIRLIDEIAESDFPYICDLQLFETINNIKLIEHIERLGKVFYRTKAAL